MAASTTEETISLSTPGKAVIPPAKLAHVVLQSAQYHSMVSYYTTFLGARVAYGDETITLLRYDDEHHRLGILNMPHLERAQSVSKAGVAGLAHMAFTYPGLRELCLAWLQRREHGIESVWSVNHGPTTSVYYRDPDGNVIETQCDNMDDDAADKFLRSDEFLTNPVGTDFNMEELIERLKSGESEEVLMKRIECGPRGIDSVPLVRHA